MGREIADGDHDGKRTSKTRRWGIYPENLCGRIFQEWGCPLFKGAAGIYILILLSFEQFHSWHGEPCPRSLSRRSSTKGLSRSIESVTFGLGRQRVKDIWVEID